ncbi:hypothetical protein CLOM_g4150, partial [Closterium sp. NIES-68]
CAWRGGTWVARAAARTRWEERVVRGN